jgi:hypothetical protein
MVAGKTYAHVARVQASRSRSCTVRPCIGYKYIHATYARMQRMQRMLSRVHSGTARGLSEAKAKCMHKWVCSVGRDCKQHAQDSSECVLQCCLPSNQGCAAACEGHSHVAVHGKQQVQRVAWGASVQLLQCWEHARQPAMSALIRGPSATQPTPHSPHRPLHAHPRGMQSTTPCLCDVQTKGHRCHTAAGPQLAVQWPHLHLASCCPLCLAPPLPAPAAHAPSLSLSLAYTGTPYLGLEVIW